MDMGRGIWEQEEACLRSQKLRNGAQMDLYNERSGLCMEILKACRIHEAGHWFWWLPWAPSWKVDEWVAVLKRLGWDWGPSQFIATASKDENNSVRLGSMCLSCVLLCKHSNAFSLRCGIKGISTVSHCPVTPGLTGGQHLLLYQCILHKSCTGKPCFYLPSTVHLLLELCIERLGINPNSVTYSVSMGK